MIYQSGVSCRLCMANSSDTNLNLMNQELSDRTFICIGIKIKSEFSLQPLQICITCEEKVNKFYTFKQKCIENDAKFKSINNLSTTKNIRTQLNSDDDFIAFDTCTTDIVKPNICIKEEVKLKILDEPLKLCYQSKQQSNEGNTTKFICGLHENYSEVKSNFIDDSENNNEIKQSLQITLRSKEQKNKQKIIRRQYQCHECGKIFKHKNVLENHIKSHRGIKMYSCELCPRKFIRADYKVVHMRIHLGLRPYVCEICGKPNTRKQDLTTHMKIHSEERKYSCKLCEKKFKRSGDVSKHMTIHTNDRPYVCTTCDKSYRSKSGLNKHLKIHKKNKKEMSV